MPEIVVGLIAGIAIFGGALALGRLLAASPLATLASIIGVTVGLVALLVGWPGLLLADAAVLLLLSVLADALRRAGGWATGATTTGIASIGFWHAWRIWTACARVW